MRSMSLALNWVLISRSFQRIFKYIQWYAQEYLQVWPSKETIALACKCTSRTVGRAIAYFKALGWLVTQKRAYRSSVYYLDDELIHFNVDNPENFKRKTYEKYTDLPPNVPKDVPQNVSQNVPIYKSTKSPLSSSTSSTGHSADSQNVERRQGGSGPLREARLSDSERKTLNNKFSEQVLIQAVDDAKWYMRQGNKILSLFGFLCSRSHKIKNQG